jgi:hypothetical protein
MSSRRVALIGSWPQRSIDEHRRWLEAHGPHPHGWANKLSAENRALIEATIGQYGHVHFYAYMSLGQGGAGTVRYRLALDGFAYHWPAIPFTSQHGQREGAASTPVTLILTVHAVEELVPARPISQFVTVAGRPLSRRAMRGLYVVHEHDAIAGRPPTEEAPHALAARSD